MLLDGFVAQDRSGRHRTKYFRKGSAQEQQARQALARLLRSNRPLAGDLRQLLANLFDPPPGQQRRIRFAQPGRGKTTDHLANTEVVMHVQAELCARSSLTQAYESAANKFSISEVMVKRVFNRYRRVYGKNNLKKVLGFD
jgi:hypothetical protein